MEDLAESIIRSVYFDLDHCYGFYDNLKHVTPSKEEYTLFADIGEEVNPWDKGVRTTMLTDVFQPKKKMLFLFDYGDDWRFLITCAKIEETKSMFRRPKILDAKGTRPSNIPITRKSRNPCHPPRNYSSSKQTLNPSRYEKCPSLVRRIPPDSSATATMSLDKIANSVSSFCEVLEPLRKPSLNSPKTGAGTRIEVAR